MNILVPHSWLTEFIKTNLTPIHIKEILSLHSASVERIIKNNDDWIYDIEITTNRIDMACVIGLARELAAVLNTKGIKAQFKPLIVNNPKVPRKTLPIKIVNNQKLCERILGIVIDNVECKPSPLWIRQRLEQSGVRSLNTIVDVTNYVMLETGQPTHVFDYDRIKTHELHIRESKKGEKLTTFEGKNYILSGGDIVIDDGTGTIIDLPGIAGTKNSVVTKNTKRILFFTESNDPIRIRQTAMKLGIHTYAANINKNRPDPEGAKKALLRGIDLFNLIARGTPASTLIDDYKKQYIPNSITVSQTLIDQYIGTPLKAQQITSILNSLGISSRFIKPSATYQVVVPSWRQFDIAIAEDIIEEVARMYGYYQISNRVLIGKPITKRSDSLNYWITKTKHALKYFGYTECYTSSLVSKQSVISAGFDPKKCVELLNPLTEDSTIMRPSLIPLIVSVLDDNKSRTKNIIRFFELSRVYKPRKNGLPREPLFLCLGITNMTNMFQSYLDMKGVVETLVNDLGIRLLTFFPSKTSYDPTYTLMDKNLRAVLYINEQEVGCIGKFKDTIITHLDATVLFSFSSIAHSYCPIPEHPPVIEDITFTLPKKTYIAPVLESIEKTDPLIQSVKVIDQYEQNYTIRIVFQDPKRNLSDKEIASIKKKIIKKIILRK